MKIQENIPLAPYTTFKIGGAAKFFCEVNDEKEILKALEFARGKKMPVFILGGGSNVLVSDKGFGGLVIRIQNSKLKIPAFAKASAGRQNSIIECDSGCILSKILSESVKAGLTGMEWVAGIPGTIGGAVRGNAGAFGETMGDMVESVRILDIQVDQGSVFSLADKAANSSRPNLSIIPQGRTFELEDCNFSYRDSVFKQNPNLLILSATFKLKNGNQKESEKKVKEILAKRKEKQPMDFPSAGSFFKNPVAKDQKLIREFERDMGKKIKDKKIPAGYLIDQLDLRGKKIGGAMVSEKHANFIVNAGNATAENVVMLAAVIKTKVRNKFGIQLQEEVQMVGF